MLDEHYKELGEYLGLDFNTGNNSDFEDGLPIAKSPGDRYKFIDGFSRAKCITPEKAWSMCGDEEINWHEFRRFRNSLIDFKKDRGILDFCDILEMASEPLDVKVAIIDEAQDLSSLQWKFALSLFRNAERIYVAGDDDQAIYQWSGANVKAFINLPCEKTVLSQSHRIPKSVHNLAEDIAKRIHNRSPKHYNPRKQEGFVDYHAYLDSVDLSSGTWLVLARNVYMLKQLSKYVKSQGVLFSYRGDSVVKKSDIRAIQIWEAWRKGVKITDEEKLYVHSYLPKGTKEWPKDKIWHEALTKIPLEDREYLVSLLRRGEKITKDPRINVTTIHSVKGGEAENVLLMTDIAIKTHKGMEIQPDNEHRVFYVGATRAKENLHIIMPQTKLYYDI